MVQSVYRILPHSWPGPSLERGICIPTASHLSVWIVHLAGLMAVFGQIWPGRRHSSVWTLRPMAVYYCRSLQVRCSVCSPGLGLPGLPFHLDCFRRTAWLFSVPRSTIHRQSSVHGNGSRCCQGQAQKSEQAQVQGGTDRIVNREAIKGLRHVDRPTAAVAGWPAWFVSLHRRCNGAASTPWVMIRTWLDSWRDATCPLSAICH